MIETKLTAFDVSIAQLAELSRAGVDSSVIQAMVHATADAELMELLVDAIDAAAGVTAEDAPVEDEERNTKQPWQLEGNHHHKPPWWQTKGPVGAKRPQP